MTENNTIRLITAVAYDGTDIMVLPMPFGVCGECPDLTKAVRDACADYLGTDEGKATYASCGNRFDWSDFWTMVPNSFCEKHGFVKLDDFASVECVDMGEQIGDGTSDN